MANLSRPVIAFALLRHCGDLVQTDLLGGVAVLIRPLISDLTGQIYDAANLAERLAKAYGISLPASALEDFTSRLASAGILTIEEGGAGLSRAIYAPVPESDSEDEKDETLFQGIIDDFVAHATNRLVVTSMHISQDDLIGGFLRRLCTLDFSSLRARPLIVEGQGTTTLLGPAAKEARALSQQLSSEAALDALVASYIGHLQAKNADWLKVLSEVADGALGLELVLDLQAPTSVPRLTSTTAVIDTPILLSYLDLSSKQQHDAAVSLIEQLSQSGMKIAAFQHSIEEAESVLHAIDTARQLGHAYGPTVARMSSPTYRAFFETMRGRIAHSWQQKHNFELIQETAVQFYKNFTEEDEVELIRRIRTNIVDRYLTSERDAKSVAETMRRLGGSHTSIGNIASCKYVFVTSNSSVQRRSASFLRDNGFVNRGELVPIMTDRYAAGLCWLISGGRAANSPTTARLLANCAVALRSRPELIARTKRFLAELDAEKALHFEALMTNERASQFLMEVTLGNLDVITANNVEEIFSEAQRRAAETVSKEKDAHYGAQVADLAMQVEASAEELAKLQDQLQQAALDNEAKQITEVKLQQETVALTQQVEEQRIVAAAQAGKLAAMEASIAALTEVASNAIVDSAAKKNQAIAIATRFVDRRMKMLRIGGAVSSLSAMLLLALADKFLVPSLRIELQSYANLVLIGIQLLLGGIGLSLISEKIFEIPMQRWGAKLYAEKLSELGYS
ncbi:hypothetical protein [Massilia sp. CF038]|uniref:hypothetical protein n=1 Tax=Massilia sp. CF038 TaxID=1881045 RepID=UPI0009132556|nr:hypothetical protein [Massilia sp. CF038]SHH70292.1 hypothetical protein SAMN05428948_5023 [Massilia sp. CF038]